MGEGNKLPFPIFYIMNNKYCPDCIIAPYSQFCQCKNGGLCVYVRRCSQKLQWLPTDTMARCPLRSDKQKGNVRFVKDGYLYVDVDNTVVKIKNPFNYEPNNVNIELTDNGYTIKQ